MFPMKGFDWMSSDLKVLTPEVRRFSSEWLLMGGALKDIPAIFCCSTCFWYMRPGSRYGGKVKCWGGGRWGLLPALYCMGSPAIE
jgi:hypothetical protein